MNRIVAGILLILISLLYTGCSQKSESCSSCVKKERKSTNVPACAYTDEPCVW
jgi:PBP1b-binding outer membrane lipoprotein LpoB